MGVLCACTLYFGIATSADATVINLDLVAGSPAGFQSYSVDPVTGKYYSRYFFTGSTFNVYDNAADFEAGIISSTGNLSPSGFAGTYFEVYNGKLYGRDGTSGSSISVWDATTGVREGTASNMPDMGGINGTHTFNWGGYSGVNWMQDQTGRYVFGKKLDGSAWLLKSMDGLNVSQTQTVAAGALGYAFMINGYLFGGDSFNSNSISTLFDSSTGNQSVVDFTLDYDGFPYWQNTFYDSNSDILYLSDEFTGLYKVTDASVKFGVSAVPIPPALWLFGSGLLWLIGVAKRGKS